MKQLSSFFGNQSIRLTRLYASNGRNCDAAAWHRNVDGKNFTLTVANTTQGKMIGGYFQNSWKPVSSYSTLTKFFDPSAFMFSLTENVKISNNPSYFAGSVRPGQLYTLVDWGYENLHLRMTDTYQKQCQGFYNQNYGPQYKSPLTGTQFTGFAGNWFDIASLETFQVEFL